MMDASELKYLPRLFFCTWTDWYPGLCCLVAWIISSIQLWWPLITTCPDSMETLQAIDLRVEYDPERKPKNWKTFMNTYCGWVDECNYAEAFNAWSHATGVAST